MTADVGTTSAEAEFIRELRLDLMDQHHRWLAFAGAVLVDDTGEANDNQSAAFVAASMLANYTYTLAAALGLIEQSCGTAEAGRIARIIEDVINDGDERDLNRDVDPTRDSKASER